MEMAQSAVAESESGLGASTAMPVLPSQSLGKHAFSDATQQPPAKRHSGASAAYTGGWHGAGQVRPRPVLYVHEAATKQEPTEGQLRPEMARIDVQQPRLQPYSI